jgi:Protein of unknown function (DUF968)
MQRQPRARSETHLAFIRTLPCIVCGNNIETEAAHIRMADRSVAKPMTGIATKCDDRFTVPLCGSCHRAQHACGNENRWWADHGMDPIKLALALYSVSGDYERGEQIVSPH